MMPETVSTGSAELCRRARANAHAVAALTENPGCTRRRLIDAAGVSAHDLAVRLGQPTLRGQSPFAIETGNRFEDRLKVRSGYELLVDALAPFVELPKPPDLIVEDVNRVGRIPDPQAWMDARAKRTDVALTLIARGDADAPHIVDHPVLRFDLAGSSVNLEPDALAFRIGEKLELVEIKSYPIIDGQADPGKLSSTAGQSAVYHMALRATLERLGFDPDLLVWSVILVAPRNFGRTPVAHRLPLTKKSMSICARAAGRAQDRRRAEGASRHPHVRRGPGRHARRKLGQTGADEGGRGRGRVLRARVCAELRYGEVLSPRGVGGGRSCEARGARRVTISPECIRSRTRCAWRAKARVKTNRT